MTLTGTILLWHADIACPKCAGQDYWTKQQRCEGLMSWQGPKDQHVETYVTPSTEAFACIYFENLLSKFIYEVECDKENPQAKPRTSHDKKSDRWATKWSDAKIGQSVFGGWSPEALTKFLNITRAITEARKWKMTKKADKWLLRAICDRHKYVEKDEKKKKVKISAPKANAAEVVIVPFDCEKEAEAKAGDVDLSALGIDGFEVEFDDVVDSDDSNKDDESEPETDPVSGANLPLGPNQGSNPAEVGNPGPVPPQPPTPAVTGASAAAS